MKYLLIIAHGSRREASNEEVKILARKVAQTLPDDVNHVNVAFLELASPSIGEAIDDCFNSGATELVVLPFFLSAGRHVVTDIPSEVERAMRNWPGKKLTMLGHIGSMDAIINLIKTSYLSTED